MAASKKSKTTYPKYSVLMSVYKNDNPTWLKIAINSMLDQTMKPSEFVIVEDGPIPAKLAKVISEFTKNHSKIFKIVKLKQNLGLGPALKIGIENCSNEYIARMDSDDYSVPTRIEEEFKIFQKHPELSLVGSNVNEFEGNIKNIVSQVILPEKSDEILKFAKRRCPLRHPSLLYKKSAVEKAGNYRAYHLCEDYDLYTRMLQNDAKFYNIQKPLTFMRVDDNFYKRRGGIKYLKSILKFKREQVKTGFFTKADFIKSSIPHIINCLLPTKIRTWVYVNLLRSQL